jgi:hypothetical protein
MPLPTVVDIDRKLVKAKLRTKEGRGFNAAQMAPLDAARLLNGRARQCPREHRGRRRGALRQNLAGPDAVE